MARTIAEIKKSMTDAFMLDNTLRKAYGITGNPTWDDTFSSVSTENILLHTVAACVYSLEAIFESFRTEIDQRIDANIVPSLSWYREEALKFQLGDALVYDETTRTYKYAVTDSSKQKVKRCTVYDRGSSLSMLVSGDEGGLPVKLGEDVLVPFREYISKIKIAGVIVNINSFDADTIKVRAKIQIDPLVMNSFGQNVISRAYPVEDAINAYVAANGTLNKTKLVDAIQAVDGVVDVTLEEVQAKTELNPSYEVVVDNNYESSSGAIVTENLRGGLRYVV